MRAINTRGVRRDGVTMSDRCATSQPRSLPWRELRLACYLQALIFREILGVCSGVDAESAADCGAEGRSTEGEAPAWRSFI